MHALFLIISGAWNGRGRLGRGYCERFLSIGLLDATNAP